MTRSGDSYMEGLRDGRQVYIDGELVGDVTRHPAVGGSVAAIARLYDLSHDPANQELLTFKSPFTSQPVNRSFMIPVRGRSGAAAQGAETPVGEHLRAHGTEPRARRRLSLRVRRRG